MSIRFSAIGFEHGHIYGQVKLDFIHFRRHSIKRPWFYRFLWSRDLLRKIRLFTAEKCPIL